MLFTKRKRLRRRLGNVSQTVQFCFDSVNDLFPTTVLFLFVLTVHQFALACGPGGGGGSPSGRKKTFLQSIDSNSIDEPPADGKLLWDINQWLPNNFRSSGDQAVISVLNPNLRNAFGDIVAKSFDSGTASGQPVICPSDLTCDFSNWRLCRWRNSKDEDAEFYVGEGSVDPDRLQLYTGTRVTPNSPFLLTAANRGDYKALLVSDIVPEQPGDGTLEFRYWLTPLVELRICTRTIENPDLLTCSDSLNLNGAPGPAIVTIPGPIREPFEIVFEVKNFVTDPGGIAFIDDLAYVSSLCDEDAPPRIKVSPVPSKHFARPRPDSDLRHIGGGVVSSICDAVPCSFDNDRTCGYNLLGAGAGTAWRIVHGPIGNRATGIQHDVNGNMNSSNPYLVAAGERRGIKDLFVAQSPPFRLERPVSVRFFRHLLSSTSQLRVCLFDATSLCPSTFRIDVEALDWQESVVDLDPAEITADLKTKPITLLFVAEGLKQNNFIGIDNIEVRERNGSPAC